jgi:hypothetical protein
MNIGIPVAQYHAGNTGEYVQRALVALGHTARILTPAEFFPALRGRAFDYFLCVDSSDGLALDDPSIAACSFETVGYWFIDFRHNKNRATRIPNDLDNARLLERKGGWIFQSQIQDVRDCQALGLTRVSWLPLAADPHIWSDGPVVQKELHIGFVGNVWDLQRKKALELLLATQGLRVGFLGHGVIWKEEAAALLRKCMVGFNINSFFGEPFSYDVNMRFFETLSCGIPIFTNDVPSLKDVVPHDAPFVRTYTTLQDLLPGLLEAFKDPQYLASGPAARQWVLDRATYEHRMKDVLGRIGS